MPAFLWRILFAIIWTFVSQYYFEFADTNHYYQAVLDMHRAVLDDPSYLKDIYFKLKFKDDNRIFPYFLYDQLGITHYYMYDVKNYLVPRVALLFLCLEKLSGYRFCLSFLLLEVAGGCLRCFTSYIHIYTKNSYRFCFFLPAFLGVWGC
ncbi:MAG: hypothetical protein IPP39_15580 [Chitinophagaceae bacterium]|nr:hypothetical protein [Chitinophagaceae bacterium]